MNQAIKSIRIPTSSSSPAIFSFPSKKACVLRFKKLTTVSASSDMDKTPKQATEKTKQTTEHGDVMSHPFGEGYATRSDEEGFGGIYGRNQSFREDDTGEKIHEDHHDYDKNQGSEVKEKERGRHSTRAHS